VQQALQSYILKIIMVSDQTLLYISHGLSSFGDRVWQFAIPVLFLQIWPDSLLAVAVSQFVTYLGLTIFMPLIGSWVGKTHRLTINVLSIIFCNGCTVRFFFLNPTAQFLLLLLAILVSSQKKVVLGSFPFSNTDHFFFSFINSAKANLQICELNKKNKYNI
jgi:hypothetical protein